MDGNKSSIGVAIIKAEYLVKPQNQFNEQTDENFKKRNDSADSTLPPPAKKIKLRGKNKKRPRDKKLDCSEKLCPNVIAGRECKFGEKCKFSHKLESFRNDFLIDFPCSIFKKYGTCPFGPMCLFSKDHISQTNSLTSNCKNNLCTKQLMDQTDNILPETKIEDKQCCINDMDEVPILDNDKSKLLFENTDKDLHEDTISHASENRREFLQRIGITNAVAKEVMVQLRKKEYDFTHADKVKKDVYDENSRNSNDIKLEKVVPLINSNILIDNKVTPGHENIIIDDGFTKSNNIKIDCSIVNPNQDLKDVSSISETFSIIEYANKDANLGCIVCPDYKYTRKIDLRHKLYLAPLTTVGNLPFRRICKRLGAEVTCGEMAVSTNLLQGKPSEWALMKRHQEEDIYGIQLCGTYADNMVHAAQAVTDNLDVDFIDINVGCPIDFIVQRGDGCGMMKRIGKLETAVKCLVQLSRCPITIKMRAGVQENKNVAHNVIPKINNIGLSLITLHARSMEQRYTKLSDWAYITTCQQLAKPTHFFGNGDVLSFSDYYSRLEETKVDGCMIGRGALIKPWIFTEIREKRHWDISSSERLDIMRDFVDFGLEHWGSDQQGVNNTRRFLLEWLSFTHRYIPVGLLEHLPQRINDKPPTFCGRNQLETLMASHSCSDWIKICEMFLGKVPSTFTFLPKHKANSY